MASKQNPGAFSKIEDEVEECEGEGVRVVSRTMTYGQTLKWTRTGSVERFQVSGHATNQGAKRACLDLARKCGWEPPRWYEVSRWGDTRVIERDDRLIYRAGMLRDTTLAAIQCGFSSAILIVVALALRATPLSPWIKELVCACAGAFTMMTLLILHHDFTCEKIIEDA